MRATISPIKPRETASGLHRINVRSIAIGPPNTARQASPPMEELGSGAFAAVRYVGETGSTNADAAELLGDPRFAGLTIVAEYQTRGSGRKGRSWLAQPGTALLFTTILPRPIDSDRLWTVPFWTALAVGRALDVCGVAAALQWPNDLLIDDRKVAGILCTSRVTGRNAHVGCGVGINVHRRAGAQAGIEPPPAFCDDRNQIGRAHV